MKLILIAIAIAALLGWFTQYISTLTLMWYLTEKGFPLPSDADLKKGSRYVVSHLFRDFGSGKR